MTSYFTFNEFLSNWIFFKKKIPNRQDFDNFRIYGYFFKFNVSNIYKIKI